MRVLSGTPQKNQGWCFQSKQRDRLFFFSLPKKQSACALIKLLAIPWEVSINPENSPIELIIKLGSHKNMRSLFEDGVIYMNTLEFYRTLEADDERRDVNEGAERVRNCRGGTLKLKNPEIGGFEEIAQLTHSRIRELNSNLQNLNVFCSYYLKVEMPIRNLGTAISERAKFGFGEYAVVVADAGEFVTRIKQAAVAKGYKHFRRLVKYVDFSQDDFEVGPFVKDHIFAHQNELRIAVFTGENTGAAIQLEIGSLEDIAIMVPAKALDEISIQDKASNAMHATLILPR